MADVRQIELWLLDQGGWVPGEVLRARFGLRERELRADGDRDGLLDRFAVSNSQRGYCHVRHLKKEDFLRVTRSLLRHGVRELRKVSSWRKARHAQRVGLRQDLREVATGQGLLPL
jgi:hypothetical protein